MTAILVLLVVAVLVGLYVVATYNRLVGLTVRSDNAWSDIDVQLKRRHDLVPNLVETVKGYAAHEKSTLDTVIQARARAMSASGTQERAAAENQLTHALKSLFALAEAYPQLRAVESFTALQSSLEEIEDALQNARRYYNAVVRDLNTGTQQFPSNVVANLFHIEEREFFVIDVAESARPEVRF
ncbi:MAG: LemA family protein [Longimicrobiales bacterium]